MGEAVVTFPHSSLLLCRRMEEEEGKDGQFQNPGEEP